MKKRIIAFIISLAAAIVFVSPVVAESAKVTHIVGKVEVNRGGKWVPLNVSDSVEQSETINTGFNSEAVLKFNGSVFKIAALSRVKLDSLVASENKVSITVNSGAVRSKVSKPSDGSKAKYTVGTPVAVASVRGTNFIVTADGSVKCTDGKVAVWSRRKYASYVQKVVDKAKKSGVDIEDMGVIPDLGNLTDIAALGIDFDDWSFGGDVNVTQGQSTELTTSGNPKKPMNDAADNVTKPRTYVTTAAEKDALDAGGEAAIRNEPGINIEIKIELPPRPTEP